MTVLLYIFAAIGAVVTICGIIALGFDIYQTRDDMTYYLHTRFPELEKEIAEKLAAFEAKLNNEGFVHKDQYDEDWNEFTYRLNTISDNLEIVTNFTTDTIRKRLDEFENKFVTKDDYYRMWTENKERVDHIAYRLNDVENMNTLPRTITGNSPYDIHLTEITVGDDPNQMSKGTTI